VAGEEKNGAERERDEEKEREKRVLQAATVNHHTEETRETEMKSQETSSLNDGEKKV